MVLGSISTEFNYKPLVSSLHPGGGSPIKTAFLEILSTCPITFLYFLIARVCKPYVSKLRSAGILSALKIAVLKISNMGIIKIPTCFFQEDVYMLVLTLTGKDLQYTRALKVQYPSAGEASRGIVERLYRYFPGGPKSNM